MPCFDFLTQKKKWRKNNFFLKFFSFEPRHNQLYQIVGNNIRNVFVSKRFFKIFDIMPCFDFLTQTQLSYTKLWGKNAAKIDLFFEIVVFVSRLVNVFFKIFIVFDIFPCLGFLTQTKYGLKHLSFSIGFLFHPCEGITVSQKLPDHQFVLNLDTIKLYQIVGNYIGNVIASN